MPRKISIRNEFHHTMTHAILPDDGWLSANQVRRIRRSLCGINGCCCGGNLSERAPGNHGGWAIKDCGEDQWLCVEDVSADGSRFRIG